MKISIFITLLVMFFIGCGRIKDPLGLECWEVISDQNEDLNSLFFIDENIGWAVGSSGKIVSTHDGGINWIARNSNSTSNLRSVLFIDEEIGFVSGNNQTLLYTNDGGQSWDKKIVVCDSGKIFSSLHSDIEGDIWFISNYGEIFNSTDLGISWECKYQLESWGYTYLYFSNSYSGIAIPGWGRTLVKTNDGCETWRSVSIPAQWMGDVFFIDGNNGWISESWGPSSTVHETVSIYFTGDRGETWTKLAGFPGVLIGNIVFLDNNHGWITITTKIYHTTDGGKSWIEQFDSENYNIGYIRDMFFVNRMDGWGLTNKGKIIRYIEQ